MPFTIFALLGLVIGVFIGDHARADRPAPNISTRHVIYDSAKGQDTNGAVGIGKVFTWPTNQGNIRVVKVGSFYEIEHVNHEGHVDYSQVTAVEQNQ